MAIILAKKPQQTKEQIYLSSDVTPDQERIYSSSDVTVGDKSDGSFLGDFASGVWKDIKQSVTHNPIIEGGLSATSGLAGGMAGLAGGVGNEFLQTVLKGPSRTPFQNIEETSSKIADLFTFKPTTRIGQSISDVANAPFSGLSFIADTAAKTVSDDPEVQAGIRLGGNVLMNTLLFKFGAKIAKGQDIMGSEIKSVLKGAKDLPKEVWSEIEKIPEGTHFETVSFYDNVKAKAKQELLERRVQDADKSNKYAEYVKKLQETQPDVYPRGETGETLVGSFGPKVGSMGAEIERLTKGKTDRSFSTKPIHDPQPPVYPRGSTGASLVGAQRGRVGWEELEPGKRTAAGLRDKTFAPGPKPVIPNDMVVDANPESYHPRWTPEKAKAPDFMLKPEDRVAIKEAPIQATEGGDVSGGVTMSAGLLPNIADKIASVLFKKSRQAYEDSLGPSEKKIRSTIATPTSEFKETISGIKQNARRVVTEAVSDSFWSVKKWEERAAELRKKPADVTKSPYESIAIMAGNEGVVENILNGVTKISDKYNVRRAEITPYIIAKKDIYRANRKISNPGGLTAQEAFASIQEQASRLGPEWFKKVEQASKELGEWSNREIIDRLTASGVLSPDMAAKIKKENPGAYLPYDIMREWGEWGNKVDVGKWDIGDTFVSKAPEVFSIDTNPLPAQKGALIKDKISNPWNALAQRVHTAVSVSSRNIALTNIVNMAKDTPELGIVKMKRGQRLPPGMGEMVIFENGVVEKYFGPIDLIKSLKHLDKSQSSVLEKVVRGPNALFRAGTIGLNLGFMGANLKRDFTGRFLLMSKGKTGMKTLGEAIASSFSSAFGFPDAIRDRMLSSGASFTGTLERSQGRITGSHLFRKPLYRFIKDFNPVGIIVNLGKAIENIPRTAGFLGTEKMGMKGMEAALQSRRISTDFGRGGWLMKALSQLAPFLNAKWQGTETTFAAATSNKGARVGTHQFFGVPMTGKQAFWTRTIATKILPSLGIYLYTHLTHPELIKEVPDEVKDKNFVYPVGYETVKETGEERIKVVKLMKDDADQMIWNPMEKLLNIWFEKEPVKAGTFAAQYLSDLSPIDFMNKGKIDPVRLLSGTAPPIGRAVVEQIAGKNLYFGNQLESQKLQSVKPGERYTERTPAIYTTIGKALNISPTRMGAFVRSAFGPVLGSGSSEQVLRGIGSRFVTSVSKQSRGDTFELSNQIDEGYSTTRLKMEREIKRTDMTMKEKLSSVASMAREWHKKMAGYIDPMTKLAQASDPSYTRKTYVNSPQWKRYTFQSKDLENLFVNTLVPNPKATASDILGLEKKK